MTVRAGIETCGHVWAVVLAGSEAIHLRPLIRRLYGEDPPAPFTSIFGSPTLLRRTFDRVDGAIPANRTVISIVRGREGEVEEALDGKPIRHVLVQPEDKGTAAGILLAAHWIHRRDPDAIIAVFPSDHFIAPEDVFIEHALEAAEVARAHPRWLVLLGAVPTDPEPDYGWIEPGDIMGWSPTLGEPISQVRRFKEKPSAMTARVYQEEGWLWNTFVFVAGASLLLSLGAQYLSELHAGLCHVRSLEGTDLEASALRRAYGLAPTAHFSEAILERCPPGLVVFRLPTLTWSDWGTPRRVLKSLSKVGILPRRARGSGLLGEAAVRAALEAPVPVALKSRRRDRRPDAREE